MLIYRFHLALVVIGMKVYAVLGLIRQVKQGGKSYQWNGPTAECFLANYYLKLQRAIHGNSDFYDVIKKINKKSKNIIWPGKRDYHVMVVAY